MCISMEWKRLQKGWCCRDFKELEARLFVAVRGQYSPRKPVTLVVVVSDRANHFPLL
jgi:hypothetical protein